MSKQTKNQKPISKPKKSAPAKTGLYPRIFETDSVYFLKLVVFILLGTLWLKFAQPVSVASTVLNGFPLGLILGVIGIYKFEKYQEDRKIWYAVLVVVTIICYFVPAGIII